jgi:hypothetical protein
VQYSAVVNKNDIHMGRLTQSLNSQAGNGWQLEHILEQHGNTIQIFERESPIEQLLHVQRQVLAEQKRTNQLLEWLGTKLQPRPVD